MNICKQGQNPLLWAKFSSFYKPFEFKIFASVSLDYMCDFRSMPRNKTLCSLSVFSKHLQIRQIKTFVFTNRHSKSMLTIKLMSATCIVLLLTLKSSELSSNICLAFCLLVLLLHDI